MNISPIKLGGVSFCRCGAEPVHTTETLARQLQLLPEPPKFPGDTFEGSSSKAAVKLPQGIKDISPEAAAALLEKAKFEPYDITPQN